MKMRRWNKVIENSMNDMGIGTYTEFIEKVRWMSNGNGRKGMYRSYKDLIMELVQKSQVFVDGDEETKDADWVVSKRHKGSESITEKQAATWLESSLMEHKHYGKGFGWTAAEAIQAIANGTLTADDLRNEITNLDEEGQSK